MVGPVGRSSIGSPGITPPHIPAIAPGSSDRTPGHPRYPVLPAKTSVVSAELHQHVQRAHDTETLELQAAKKIQGQTPQDLLRRTAQLATELADLHDESRKIPAASSLPAGTVSEIKRLAAINKRRAALVNKINLTTFLAEGAAAAWEIARGAECESLTYERIASSIAAAVEEVREGAGGEIIEDARNGYRRLFEAHPSFRDNGVLGQFELAASTHHAITGLIKQLQQEQRNGVDSQSDIVHLKLSDQLVKNTVTNLLQAHGGDDDDVDKVRAKELVNAIRTQDLVSELKRKHAEKNIRTYLRAISLSAGASVAGAALHYGTCRTGTEELIKTYSSLEPENSYRDAALMALASGLVLGLTYFLFNRTVAPLTKAALEKMPGLAPRPLKVTSADEVIPTVPRTSIKNGEPVDLSPAEFEKQLQAVKQKRKDFQNIERRCREGGLVGDILGYCSFGGCQFVRAMLEKSGFAPRVTGTLIGTSLEATLDTVFRLRQTFDDGEGGIPIVTLDAPQRWNHVSKGFNNLRIWSSPEAMRNFFRHMAGGVESTELSNFVLRAIGQHGDARLLQSMAAFFSAVFVVSPMYAATEFEAAEEFRDDPYAGTKTAVLAIVAPNDPRVPHATRDPDTPEGNRPLRTIDNMKKITQGLQTVVPNFAADTLTAGVKQVRDLMNRPIVNKLRKRPQ